MRFSRQYLDANHFDDSEGYGKLGLSYDTNADYDDVISTDLLTLIETATTFARIPFKFEHRCSWQLAFDMHTTTDLLST